LTADADPKEMPMALIMTKTESGRPRASFIERSKKNPEQSVNLNVPA
jgi:hypothetical protein